MIDAATLSVIRRWALREQLSIRGRKQRRTVKQMYFDLKVLGYSGSYNRVAAFARFWQAQQMQAQQTTGRGTFVPLVFDCGDAFQQVAHVKLSHSRASYLRAYPLQTHEMLFDAHDHAFEVLGGVPRRGTYDNMRSAVDRIRKGKDRDVNARLAAMVSHFLFEAEFGNRPPGGGEGAGGEECA